MTPTREWFWMTVGKTDGRVTVHFSRKRPKEDADGNYVGAGLSFDVAEFKQVFGFCLVPGECVKSRFQTMVWM